MKNIILSDVEVSDIYLSDINSETIGIIIVYSGENAIGHITYDGDVFWNFSKDISTEPDIYNKKLKDLVDTILRKYEDVTFKLLEFQ